MKIAVLNLTAGNLCGGYRKYLEEILPLMQKDKRVSQIDCFFSSMTRSLVKCDDMPIHVWPKNDMFAGYKWLKQKLSNLSPDVIFIPNAQWISIRPIPTVVMIHNMEPLISPIGGNSIRISAANIVRYLLSRRACFKADRIIGISSFVKNYLTSRWGVPESKVGVVRFGVAQGEHADCIKPKQLSLAENDTFVFTAGHIAPYRGLEDLLVAVSVLQKNNNIRLNVVIAGQAGRGTEFYLTKMKRLADRLSISSSVHWAGYLSKEEMSWCYENSSLFVMTSRVEACPNIALEAMSHGCIIVSTDSSPMPEFFGAGADYYRAGDYHGLAARIGAILTISADEKNRRRLNTLDRSRKYDWQIAADQTISELEKAVKMTDA